MDKFREKYALHNKYRMSASRTRQSDLQGSQSATSTSAPVPAPSSMNVKMNRSDTGKGKAKIYASSSATQSTASGSLDSGDTPITHAAESDTRSSRTGNDNGHRGKSSSSSSSDYHQLGSKSANNRKQKSKQHPNGYHALQPCNGGIDALELQQGDPIKSNRDNGAGTKDLHIKRKTTTQLRLLERKEKLLSTSISLNKAIPATVPQHEHETNSIQPLEQSEQQPVQQSIQNNDENVPNDDLQLLIQEGDQWKKDRIKTPKPSLASMSTPVRRKSHDFSNEATFVPTPPRMAQTHGYVHMVPTEAQLRWAQFHQKMRAALTQQHVEKLMRTPLHVQLVEGAENGDGDEFSDEHGIRSTFKLSRGRRALLRVSARRMEERRLEMKEHGYSMVPDDEESSDELEDEGASSHLSTVDESLAFDDIADALQLGDNSTIVEGRALLSTEIGAKGKDLSTTVITQNNLKKKKKGSKKKGRRARRLKGMRSMVLTADEDEERMKRFEEAYTLMCSVKKSEDNIIKSSKRWSRASNIPIAVSVDGRVYSDLQRSPTMKHTLISKRYANEVVGAELNGKKLADRGASWMMHLPKQDRSRPAKFFGHSYPTHVIDEDEAVTNLSGMSPTKKKLMEIVDRFQFRNQPPTRNVPQNQERRQDNIEQTSASEDFQPSKPDTSVSTDFRSRESSKETEEIEESKQPKKSFMQNLNLGINVQNFKDRLSQGLRVEEDGDYEDSSYTEQSDTSYEQKIQKIAAQVKSSNSIIDTDAQSDASENEDTLEQTRIDSLMMSPTIISKRLNQAIDTVRLGRWEQVGYLILANPWLTEMTDVTNEQYLLHKLAYYGGGTISETEEFYDPAPRKLNSDLVKASFAAVQKLDSFGNLPFHRAAEAGNNEMATRLAKIFPGGANVRNNDGQLPLHLAVLACANEKVKAPLTLISKIMTIFPTALAIADNDGNLPLHLATAYLPGELGAEVVHLLCDEADKQGDNLRFPKYFKTLDKADDTMSSVGSIFDDAADLAEEEQTVLSVKNALGWNPILTAIQMAADFEVLDALLTRPGVEPTAFARNRNGETILHTSMAQEFCDPSSVISILKSFPDLVIFSDESGALPIESACLRELPTEVIFAIALLDLPIDPDDDDILIREGYGGSWWFLTCDCDDNYVHVVHEILNMCDDYEQKRALCFLKDRQGNSVMSRATPKCKHELRKALRFNGRYEFVGRPVTGPDGVKVFEALDFGPEDDPKEEGGQVMIKYYGDRDTFTRAVSLRIAIHFSFLIIFAHNNHHLFLFNI